MRRIYARLAGRGDASREEAACKQAIRRWLAGKGLRLEQLCPWPVYEKGRDASFDDVFNRADKAMYENKKYLKEKEKQQS